jgi:hypothetical protein
MVKAKLFVLIALAALLAVGSHFISDMGSKPNPELDLSRTRTTANGSFVVSIEPENPEIKLGELHAWIVTVKTPDGAPVADAGFEIAGGMPDHNHGLPTSPQVTENLGGGKYRLEGVKFSMTGWWELSFDITSGETRDGVTFNMVL